MHMISGARLVAALMLAAPMATAATTDLRIVDSSGTEVTVMSAAIDYSGMLTPDKETQGIRVNQGDGQVLVKWTDVESLKLSVSPEAGKADRVDMEVRLRSGKTVKATLLKKGPMKLLGRTDLGDYTVDLDKVRSITPVR